MTQEDGRPLSARSLRTTAALVVAAALGRKLKPVTIATHSPGEELLMQDQPIPEPTAINGLKQISEERPLETLPGTITEYQMVPPETEGNQKVLRTLEDLRRLPIRDKPKPPAGASRATKRRYQNAERVTFGMALDQIEARKKEKEARRAKAKATAKMKKKARK